MRLSPSGTAPETSPAGTGLTNAASNSGVGQTSSAGQWLLALWLSTAVGRFLASLAIRGPVIFGDEENYWEMARSFFHTGRFTIYHQPAQLPTVLYPIAISPVFFSHPPRTEYLLVKLISSLLMAAAVFPAYGMAREFLEKRRALAVAVLTALLPAGSYSALAMTENLFFPVFLLTAWMCFRTLDRGAARDAILAGLLLAAGFHVKIQMLFLGIAYFVAFVGWLASRLMDRARQGPDGVKLGDVIVRALPGLIFGAMLAVRLAAGLSQHSVAAAIFGEGYAGLASPTGHIDLRWFVGTLLGMVEALSISTLFFPVAALVVSVGLVRKAGDAASDFLAAHAFLHAGLPSRNRTAQRVARWHSAYS